MEKKLRIRKDIDLDEVERYGFKLEPEKTYYEYYLKDNRTYVVIDCTTREIGISTTLYGDLPSPYIENLGILYDLFKANLIAEE